MPSSAPPPASRAASPQAQQPPAPTSASNARSPSRAATVASRPATTSIRGGLRLSMPSSRAWSAPVAVAAGAATRPPTATSRCSTSGRCSASQVRRCRPSLSARSAADSSASASAAAAPAACGEGPRGSVGGSVSSYQRSQPRQNQPSIVVPAQHPTPCDPTPPAAHLACSVHVSHRAPQRLDPLLDVALQRLVVDVTRHLWKAERLLNQAAHLAAHVARGGGGRLQWGWRAGRVMRWAGVSTSGANMAAEQPSRRCWGGAGANKTTCRASAPCSMRWQHGCAWLQTQGPARGPPLHLSCPTRPLATQPLTSEDRSRAPASAATAASRSPSTSASGGLAKER